MRVSLTFRIEGRGEFAFEDDEVRRTEFVPGEIIPLPGDPGGLCVTRVSRTDALAPDGAIEREWIVWARAIS